MIIGYWKNRIRDTLFSWGMYRPIKRMIKRFKDPYNQNQAIRYAPEILILVRDVFEKNNIDYWLDFGTLLGFERCGKLLPGDDDLDFGVKIQKSVSLSESMEQAGIVLIKRVSVEGMVAMEQYRYRGFRFDLFYYREQQGVLITYLWLPNHYDMPQPYAYSEGLSTLSEIRFSSFVTREIIFYDIPFRVPDESGRYLTQHYGEDYMTPNPNFSHEDEKNRILVDKVHEVLFYV